MQVTIRCKDNTFFLICKNQKREAGASLRAGAPGLFTCVYHSLSRCYRQLYDFSWCARVFIDCAGNESVAHNAALSAACAYVDAARRG